MITAESFGYNGNGYNQAREYVLKMAREGRAQYRPAGARHNATALVIIDGEEFGQLSTYGHYVRYEDEEGEYFKTLPLIPNYNHSIPQHLWLENCEPTKSENLKPESAQEHDNEFIDDLIAWIPEDDPIRTRPENN